MVYENVGTNESSVGQTYTEIYDYTEINMLKIRKQTNKEAHGKKSNMSSIDLLLDKFI